jgi:hypothetical protein
VEVVVTVAVGEAVTVKIWAVQLPLDNTVDEIDELLDAL